MPFGMVFAPNGSAAYVALEATGQAAASSTLPAAPMLGTHDVGPEPAAPVRSAPAVTDVLVSRFIIAAAARRRHGNAC